MDLSQNLISWPCFPPCLATVTVMNEKFCGRKFCSASDTLADLPNPCKLSISNLRLYSIIQYLSVHVCMLVRVCVCIHLCVGGGPPESECVANKCVNLATR